VWTAVSAALRARATSAVRTPRRRLVPARSFTLCPGDVVTIELDEVGQLRTPTVAGRSVQEGLGLRR